MGLSVGFLRSTSVSLDNGSKVVKLTGSVDCSYVISGTAVYINDKLLEGVSGSSSNPDGESTIELRYAYTGTSIVDGTLVAFNTIEGLRDAIRRVRVVTDDVSSMQNSFGELLTSTSPKVTIDNNGTPIQLTPYAYLSTQVEALLSSAQTVDTKMDSIDTRLTTASLDLTTIENTLDNKITLSNAETLKAKAWATSEEDVVVESGNYSSKHYAIKSQASADVSSAVKLVVQTAEANIATLYDNFDDRSLGAFAVDPTVDNDGNPLQIGAKYWNTVTKSERHYTGSEWEDPSVAASQAASSASASAVSASQDASQVALDRVQTGNDVVSTNANTTQTALDRVQTGNDVISTNADATQTGLDRVATEATRTSVDTVAAQVTLDKASTRTARTAVDTAAAQVALDKVQTGQDRTSTGVTRTAVDAAAAQVALDKIQTGKDVISTDADAVQTALDRVQTGNDAIEAKDAADIAAANSNFKLGGWSSLSGAVNAPMSFRHGNAVYMVNNPIADISLSVPDPLGTNTDYFVIGVVGVTTSPDSDRLGGKSPSHYATEQSVTDLETTTQQSMVATNTAISTVDTRVTTIDTTTKQSIVNLQAATEPKIVTKNTAFNKNFGTGATDVATGNHTHDALQSKIDKAYKLAMVAL